MQNHRLNMDLFRQNFSLRMMSVILVWIAVFASVPRLELQIVQSSSNTQEILPQVLNIVESPVSVVKSASEIAVFITIELGNIDIEKHLNITSILEQFLPVYADVLIHALIYTQTTSSFL